VTRSKSEIVSQLTHPGIVAIVRAQQLTQVVPMFEALIAGGISATEITLTTPNALGAIREARDKVGDRSLVGVGTVLDAASCRAAIDAGAEFIVTPICRPDLVAIAHAAQRPIMLGAYTPTEAQLAHESGADFVKIFPADSLGPAFVKALLAPLPHLRMVPTGGIDVNNISDFFQAGCAAVGVGSALVSTKILQEAGWSELTKRARAFRNAAQRARASAG